MSEFLTFIWREIFISFSILLTTAIDAFFLKASLINWLPSFFFPLIAKKTSFFFISLELILAFLKIILLDNFFFPLSSLNILTFKLFDKVKFLIFIASRIIFLSEKKIFFFFFFFFIKKNFFFFFFFIFYYKKLTTIIPFF